MHQQKIAGIGNIYANEILFRAGLHPRQVASKLKPDAINRLYDMIRDVLLEAVGFGGSSVRDFFAPDGTLGTYKRYHRVYGKTGEPCPNQCGTTLRRMMEERSSFICPACQPRREPGRKDGLLTSSSSVS
jgi:formamidopyrimidine-DNA glycosylase